MPRYIIQDHWVTAAEKRLTPNLSAGTILPRLIVVHFTAAQSTIGAIEHLTSTKSKASAHFVISPQGALFQLAPTNRRAWHAGDSIYQGQASVNDFSLGVELVNPGPLILKGSDYVDLTDRPWRGEVTKAQHKRPDVHYSYWASYPPAQLATALDLIAALVGIYPIKDIVGHDDVTNRKMDPGPAFPLRTFRSVIPNLNLPLV